MRKTQFPIVKLVRKPRILSFLTQIPTFLRIVGNSAARDKRQEKRDGGKKQETRVKRQEIREEDKEMRKEED